MKSALNIGATRYLAKLRTLINLPRRRDATANQSFRPYLAFALPWSKVILFPELQANNISNERISNEHDILSTT